MNNQKDNGIDTRPLENSITNIAKENHLDLSVYEFASKKTEKLVTALYMVSDCMETDDALKGKIRLLGVELLSDMYRLHTLSPVEKHSYISISLARIHELLSFIQIAYTIGFISEMNTNILKKEFSGLISDLKVNLAKDKHFTFKLNEKMFEVSEAPKPIFNSMSFINTKSPLQNIEHKKSVLPLNNLADRQDRTAKILSLIKDKKEVSIKDISLAFTDCSEKTIQRELNTLVSKGQIKKTGSKRWSRYATI